MNIEGIIFDFNGTLFKDGHYHELAWQIISKELTGREMTLEEIIANTHGVPNEATIDRLSNNTMTKAENLLWSRKKEAMYREMVIQDKDNAKLVKGATELFDQLKNKKIPFTIASASIIENIEFFFDFFQLDQWFNLNDVIYDDGSYPNKVPMFNDALKILGTAKENTLIFEDSTSGLDSAIKAGFTKVIMIQDNPEKRKELKQFPEVIKCISTFDEIL